MKINEVFKIHLHQLLVLGSSLPNSYNINNIELNLRYSRFIVFKYQQNVSSLSVTLVF